MAANEDGFGSSLVVLKVSRPFSSVRSLAVATATRAQGGLRPFLRRGKGLDAGKGGVVMPTVMHCQILSGVRSRAAQPLHDTSYIMTKNSDVF